MLDPLFINQENGNWPSSFSIHDLGAGFPNATGHNDGKDEMQPLEECGDMLIMTLGYAQRANDNAYLTQHYDILQQWNEYLVEEALIPADQISTDDFAGSLA
nr:glutaminase a [Quercus suber]